MPTSKGKLELTKKGAEIELLHIYHKVIFLPLIRCADFIAYIY